MTCPDRAAELIEEHGNIKGRLHQLLEAVEYLDDIDPDTDSIAFDQATDQLIAAARAATAVAELLIEETGTLGAALEDAAAARRNVPIWCRLCLQTHDRLCDLHEEDLAAAAEYDDLLQIILGADINDS